MKINYILTAHLVFLTAVMSLPVNAEISDGLGRNVKTKPASPAPVAPAPVAATYQGKVLSVTHGSGYSYLELEADGQRFWVAGTQLQVEVGDRVRYDENVVMENFTSKFLQRTFDRLIFASSITVIE